MTASRLEAWTHKSRPGKGILGTGLLLCERAAAVRWELSDREKAIIQQLG